MLPTNLLLQSRYRIVRPIGRGGMGAVYEAIDQRLGHPVAVKQILQGDAQAFAREARLLARLRHAALPNVTDHFVEEAGQFLVMAFIPGDDLATALLRRQRPFVWPEILPWAEQLLAVLTYLHSQTPPIIHRDIKPANLKLSQDQLILLDFGLAKGSSGSSAGAPQSTPGYTAGYAAPEQEGGQLTDARSDLYATAATIYTLLTGARPPTASQRMLARLNGAPDPLVPAHQVNPALSPLLSAVLQRALMLNAVERFANAQAMAAALQSTGESDLTTFVATAVSLPAVPTSPTHLSTPVTESRSITLPPAPEPLKPPFNPHFVGRAQEMHAYRQQLAETGLAVIVGMAGIGKTALAAALAQQSSTPDRIFWHTFHVGESVETLIWQLGAFLAWQGQPALWQMLQATVQTGGKLPPAPVLFDYLVALLRQQTYLLCLDDFHHVAEDPLLITLIERLRPSASNGEIRLLLTARQLPSFVLATAQPVLNGLSLADVQLLLTQNDAGLTSTGLLAASLATDLATDLATVLYDRTEGNAELLMLAIHALPRAARPQRLLDNLLEAADIERYLLNEVDKGLQDEERQVMHGVAVLLGYPGTRDAIEEVLDGSNVRRQLTYLTNRYLLQPYEGEGEREYGQHAMLQTFYYEMLSRRQRQAMHRRAGEYYAQEAPDALKATLHFVRAGEAAQAIHWLAKEAEALLNRGHARVLRTLLAELAEAPFNSEQAAQWQIVTGLTLAFLEERATAGQHYQAALTALATAGERAQLRVLRARACRGMGELLELENPQAALGWLQRGLVELAGTDPAERAALNNRLGAVYLYLGDYPAALTALAQSLNDLPERPSYLRSIALKNLGSVHLYLGDLARATAYAEAALAINRRLHADFETAQILVNLGSLKYTTGDWPGALVVLQQALALGEQLNSAELQAGAALNMGVTYIRTGDDQAAWAALQKSLYQAQQQHLQVIEVFAQFSLADLALRTHAWAAAAAALQAAEQLAQTLDHKSLLVALASAWAEYRLGVDEPQAALTAAVQAQQRAAALGEPVEEGIALRVLGQALLANDQFEPALAALERSFALLAAQDVYEAARTQRQLGLALLRCGKAGRPHLQAAHATFQHLGAQRELAQGEPA